VYLLATLGRAAEPAGRSGADLKKIRLEGKVISAAASR